MKYRCFPYLLISAIVSLLLNADYSVSQSSGLPLLDINKILFDFGKTKYIQIKSDTITFKNIGDTVLYINQVDSLIKPFSSNITYPHWLNKGDSLSFTINYQPVKAARDSQRVYLHADTRLSSSIALLFDVSRSMSWNFPNENITKLQAAVNAGRSFINSMLNTPKIKDEAAVFTFSFDFSINHDFTTDKAALISSLPSYTIGGTSFYMGCIESINRLKKRQFQKVLIALTDGDDTGNHFLYWSQLVIDSAIKNKVRIYTVGIGSSKSDDTLQNIATKTGGKFFKAKSSKELLDIYYNIFNLLSKNVELYFDVVGICNEPVLDMKCQESKYTNPGDTVAFPVWVHALSAQDAINMNYELKVKFNKTILYPINPGIKYNIDGSFIINGINNSNLDSLPLTELKFITLLGDSKCTDVNIEYLKFFRKTDEVLLHGNSCMICINSCIMPFRQIQSFYSSTLYQNVPNPFTDETQITFFAATEGSYVLNIYNSLGMLVKNVFEGVLNSGMHSITLDCRELESGIYTYILKAPDTSINNRMIIVK